jgi:hypothetical protein
MTYLDKFVDVLMFREPRNWDSVQSPPDYEEEQQPKVIFTTGSIVWGVMLRTALIIFLSIILFERFGLYNYWWYVLFILWFLVAYPGYKHYQKFNEKIEDLQESTLCGSCKYFEPTGQLCTLLDEHVTQDYIPCEGQGWEPVSGS